LEPGMIKPKFNSMSNSTTQSLFKGCLSLVFLLVLVGAIIDITGCGDSPRFTGTFYGYSSPSTTTIAGTSFSVGPAFYKVDFENGEKENDNIIRIKIQELQTTAEDGGNFHSAFEGTRFTNNGYIDEYAEPLYLRGTYKVRSNKNSIIISGNISTGAATEPLLFEWVVDRSMVDEDKNSFSIKQSDDLCFELPTSTSLKINVCSTRKYFVTKIIEEIESNHDIKVSDERKQYFYSQPYH
jgi:hypothetical protein